MDPQADEEPIKKSSADASASPAASNGCFDCNICLDFAADPVVTLCGHLYCWPCIYKWLQQVESSAAAAAAPQPQCPVCKAGLSEETLVPLYGRGHSSKKRHQKDVLSIPSRPSVHRESVEYHTPRAEDTPSPPPPPLPQQQYYEHAPYYGGGAGFDYLSPSSPMGTRVIQSTAGGVLGGWRWRCSRGCWAARCRRRECTTRARTTWPGTAGAHDGGGRRWRWRGRFTRSGSSSSCLRFCACSCSEKEARAVAETFCR
uniref:E3 ubiquitin-protein ligase RMA n=1 Tax=Ananas comosus var. bracteatus TaxID=296719 RepID=A0A6V7QNC4_ANACO|nr:unnamed protein product [Ananas comosus var. bracteatus]